MKRYQIQWLIGGLLALTYGSQALSAELCHQVFSAYSAEYRPTDIIKQLGLNKSAAWNEAKLGLDLQTSIVRKLKELGNTDPVPDSLFEALSLIQKTVNEKVNASPIEKGQVLRELLSSLQLETQLKLSENLKNALPIYLEKLAFEVANPRTTDRWAPIKSSEAARAEIAERFPLVKDRADLAYQSTMSANIFQTKIESAENIKFTPSHPKPPVQKLQEADPRIVQTIKDIYNLNQDPQALATYVHDLIYDTAVFMANRGKPKDLENLKLGIIPRKDALRVVVSRFISRGDEIAIIKKGKSNDYEGFRLAVLKSAIYDKAFSKANSHGRDVHLIQVDFAYSTIYNATGGNTRVFWDYIGSKKGIWFWYDLFDSSNQNPTRPEVFGPWVRKFIPFD
ncbi:hypothetical protein [Bdellovibrio sp. HCB337]|uniref:hypothetical protein n=1 Tax=Bdellovibrio sp. HCB337 TaxID=3394358 RepID=UPI0039A42B15